MPMIARGSSAAPPDPPVPPPGPAPAKKAARVPAPPIPTDRETRRQTRERQASSRSRHEGEEDGDTPRQRGQEQRIQDDGDDLTRGRPLTRGRKPATAGGSARRGAAPSSTRGRGEATKTLAKPRGRSASSRGQRTSSPTPRRRVEDDEDDDYLFFATGRGRDDSNSFARMLREARSTPPSQIREPRRVQFEEPEEDEDDRFMDQQIREYHDRECQDLRDTRRARSQGRDQWVPRSNAFVNADDNDGYEASRPTTRRSNSREYDEDMGDEAAYYSEATATPPRAPGKRATRHTPPAGSPPHKKAKFNFDRFKEGRTFETTDAVITEIARRVIVDHSLEKYLPLHYLSDEVVQQEEHAIVMTVDDEKKKIVVTRGESTCTFEEWVTWTDRVMGALAHLRVPGLIFRMFAQHFRAVRRGQREGSTWATWRSYDIAMRRRLCYDKPPDIGIFDKKLFDLLERNNLSRMMAQQEKLNARTERMLAARPTTRAYGGGGGGGGGSSYRPAQPHASTSRSRAPSNGNGGSRYVKSSYGRCLLCGSTSHAYSRDKGNKQLCTRKPSWLVWDKAAEVYKIPGEDAVACWRYNSHEGCRLDTCRLRDRGHRCTLCGSRNHGCQDCSK